MHIFDISCVFSIPRPDSLPDKDTTGLPLYDVAHDAVITLDPAFGMGKTNIVHMSLFLVSLYISIVCLHVINSCKSNVFFMDKYQL